MKATLEIPDDLYRRVKARSAIEGRPIRAVAVQLFQDWLEAEVPSGETSHADSLTEKEIAKYPWLKISRKYISPGMSHDMDEIRKAIARGSAAEYADKLSSSQS